MEYCIRMSIFTRRTIQNKLNSLVSIVGKRKLRQFVRGLNIEGNVLNNKKYLESLAITWEVVILSAFSELGDTKYEKKISNGKKPDIFYCDKGVTLIADVFTVSDDQQNKKNPVEAFSIIVMDIWRDSGLHKGGLSWRVEGVELKQKEIKPKTRGWDPIHLSYRLRPINRRPIKRLALPPVDQLSEYVHKKVSPFFEKLHMFPDEPAHIEVNEQYNQNITVRFFLSYNPSGNGFYGNYPSYNMITDMESHVLWRRLIEKSNQFSHANENSPRILFVCDGDCAALQDSSISGPNEYRCDEMINHFWRRPISSKDYHNSWIVDKNISAIVVLPIVPINAMSYFPDRRDFTLKPKFYLNPYCCFPVDRRTVELLQKVVEILPVPVESPGNVIRTIRSNNIPYRRLGVLTMNYNSIEMSGVELLRILSGDLSLEDFCKNYDFPTNPFKNALMSFQSIKSVKVEAIPDRDDDKIVIEFGFHDPALGPFVVPKSCK